MNSFTLTAVGQLARDPELVSEPDGSYTRLLVVGSDYAGKDPAGAVRTVATGLWFVAFGPLGEMLARNTRRGDQLFIEAQVRADDHAAQPGEAPCRHIFIVAGFRFGAPGRLIRQRGDGPHADDAPPAHAVRALHALRTSPSATGE